MHTVRGLHRSAAAAASASAAGVAAHAAAAAGLPAAASAWRVGGTTLRAFSSLRSVPTFRASSLPLSSGVAAAPASAAAVRGLHCSRAALGLEEFFYRQQAGPTGRSWRVADLRTKGWHDIQRLWFVLLKERNMLLTYRHQCRVTGDRMDVVSATTTQPRKYERDMRCDRDMGMCLLCAYCLLALCVVSVCFRVSPLSHSRACALFVQQTERPNSHLCVGLASARSPLCLCM